jgi:RNA polymerase subunit RPABC4/transcription elongation factor Spt4
MGILEDGVWQDIVRVAVIILIAYGLVMWIAALVWTYRDIQARTRDIFGQVLAVVLVFMFNLPGLLLYLILRPRETLTDQYDRQLEAEALLHEIQEQATCPTCRRKIQEDFFICPFCRSTLRAACESCGKALSAGWVLCPYCGVDRVTAVAPAAQQQSLPSPTPAAPPEERRAERGSGAGAGAGSAPAKTSADPAVDAG